MQIHQWKKTAAARLNSLVRRSRNAARPLRTGLRQISASAAAAASVSFAGWTIGAQAHDLNDLSGEQRSALHQEIRQYLLTNPEILVEVISALERQQEENAASMQQQALVEYADELFSDENSWVGGNVDGDITIVEFVDYRCGFCRKAYPEIQQLLASDGNIRFVVKEYPILGENSVLSSKLAIAALKLKGDSAYEKVHDHLISITSPIGDAVFADVAELIGVDVVDLALTAQSDEVQRILSANYSLGERLSIGGTPAFVVGGTLIGGYLPLDQMRSLVQAERSKGS